MSDILKMIGSVQIPAAAARHSRLRIVAYTGGAINPDGPFGQVIVDLPGIKLGGSVTLLDGHSNRLEAIIGAGRPFLEGGRLIVEGTLSDDSAQSVLSKIAAGVDLQASIGLKPTQFSQLDEGAEVEVNGRTFQIESPTTLVETSELLEVSILPVAADPNTTVTIMAAKAAESQRKEKNNMNMKTKTSTENINPSPPIATDVTAERDRCTTILAAFPDNPAEAQIAITEGHTIAQANARAINILRAERPNVGPAIHAGYAGYAGGNGASNKDILSSAFLLRAGRSDLAESSYGAGVVQAADSLHATSMYDILRSALHMPGNECDATVTGNRNAVIKAGLSTMDLTNALSNAMGKLALSQYAGAPAIWKMFAKILPLNDFKSHDSIRVTFGTSATLPKLAPGGQIKYATATDSKYTNQLATYAQLLAVDRTVILNDDLGMILQFTESLARRSAATISDLVFEKLLGNASSFFGSGNANIATAAMTLDAVSGLVTLMRKQTSTDGSVLDIQPMNLIVPPELESLGKQILTSTNVNRDTTTGLGTGTGNPMFESLKLGVEPRLSTTGFHANSSATGYYITAGPNDAVMTVGLLGGAEGPTIETVDPGPDQLGVVMRGWIDADAALADPRAGAFSDGTV